MTPRLVELIAGVSLCFLGSVAYGALPFLDRSARTDDVTAVVRNDLGQLKWVATEATELTPLEAAGQRVYMRGGCFYCHSQYVRPVSLDSRPWGPVTADNRRWGPETEPGEYALDLPHRFGPGGVGPDLSREGLKYSDEWHLAHFWNPPMMTRGSLMGGFSGLFDAPAAPVKIVDGGANGNTLEQSPETKKFFDFASTEQVKLTPNADGVLFIPMTARGKYPLIWTPNKEYAGATVKLVAETKDIEALIAYVQKLGMNRGQWRDLVTPEETDGSKIDLPRSADWIAHGKEVYERRCTPCHGVEGDGNGWAATFLYKQRPRNFTFGEFKFRLTKGPLPTDADLLRTITRGVRGTAMPAWFELPLDDRLAVMQYIKYVLAVDKSDPQNPQYFFVDEQPGAPLTIGTPPSPSPDMVAHGESDLAASQMLGMPWQDRQGRRSEGGGIEGRLGLSHSPREPDEGPLQVGTGGDRYLPHDFHRADGNADAVVPGCLPGTGSLGVGVLYPVAFRLHRSVDGRAAADRRGGSLRARQSDAQHARAEPRLSPALTCRRMRRPSRTECG